MSVAVTPSSLDQQQVLALIGRACGNDADAVLWACDRLTAWVEAQRLRAIRLQADQASGGHGSTTDADTPTVIDPHIEAAMSLLPPPTGPVTLRTPRDTEQLHRRAEVAALAPAFAAALDTADITATHLDRLGETLRRLEPGVRQRFLDDEGRHLAIARATHAHDFARHLRREEARLGRLVAGDRLEQQRRQVQLRQRVDHDTGMHHFVLTLDPLSAVRLSSRLDGATESLFHRAVPDGSPTDPFERQAFLRAHALLSLLDGKGGAAGRPEIVIVVDTTVVDGPPDIDWGLPVEVPERVLRDLHTEADVHAVVVRNGVVLHAPGALNLGRSTRLASRHQRRALRALYRGCAVPGCDVRFDLCTVHHVEWWRAGGRTDLANLLPLCHRHHGNVHRDGWVLQLGPRRQLSVTLPDGTVRSTGPPRRSAA